MKPEINVPALFHVPPRNWPRVNRGNINRVQKILKPNHVTGIPTHWPKIYYGQTRANLNLNRTYRNVDTATLPDGVYLYLIEYSPAENRYYKSFVQVRNLLESGSRHFQLPVRNKGRVILAAGELSKQTSAHGTIKILFNLESGTYTKNLMTAVQNYMGEANTENLRGKNKKEIVEAKFVRLVKNALRNSTPNVNKNYVTNILIPKIPGNLQNLLARGNCSFYYGTPTNRTRARVVANLKAAGLNGKSAQNLIRTLAQKTPCARSPNKGSSTKRLRNE